MISIVTKDFKIAIINLLQTGPAFLQYLIKFKHIRWRIFKIDTGLSIFTVVNFPEGLGGMGNPQAKGGSEGPFPRKKMFISFIFKRVFQPF